MTPCNLPLGATEVEMTTVCGATACAKMEEEQKENLPRAGESGQGPGQLKQRCRLDGQEHPTKVTPAAYRKDFSDPVYKEIAVTNGQINRMTRDELRTKLAELHLETRGVKDVLRKRFKNYCKKQKLTQNLSMKPECSDMYYDYICVIDFEATCEENNPPEYLHEIIEFPIALVNTRTLEIEDTFQAYVKPELKPTLTDFCTKLTGITQDMVDKAGSFPDVLQRVVDWMRERELGTKCRYAVLTDGSWDMSKFLNVQCHLSSIEYPRFAKKWINIRKSYGNFYKVPRAQTKLASMLENLGMMYEGRPHSGLDDSRNIARIAIRMLQDGCALRVNECLHAGQLVNVPNTSPLESAPPPCSPWHKI